MVVVRLALLSLLFFPFISCGASLQIPAEITVLSVNGQQYQNSLFSSEIKIPLIAGRQLLVLEYKDIFDNYDEDDHTKVTSEPFVIIFTSSSTDALFLRLPDINDEASARDFVEHLNVSLSDSENRVQDVFIQDLMKYKQELMFESGIDMAKNEKTGEQPW